MKYICGKNIQNPFYKDIDGDVFIATTVQSCEGELYSVHDKDRT